MPYTMKQNLFKKFGDSELICISRKQFLPKKNGEKGLIKKTNWIETRKKLRFKSHV